MKNELIEEIKSRGYFRINFKPTIYKPKLTTLKDCKEIVEECTVRLRRWDYPHFPRRIGDDTGLEPCGEYYQGWVDWSTHKEFWRMYKSGQFLHYLALTEDWFEKNIWGTPLQQIKPMTLLGIIGTVVYQMTEIYEFLSRLTRKGIYDDGVVVSISLHNTKQRELWVEDNDRSPLFLFYKTGVENLNYNYKFSKEDMLIHSKEKAFSTILEIFDAFGWDNPPLETIKKDLETLLSGGI